MPGSIRFALCFIKPGRPIGQSPIDRK